MDPVAFAPDDPWGLDPDLQRKRALLAGAGGRFCGVEFVKKDGTVRRMQVQPAVLRHRGRGAPWGSDTPGRRAARTRALRHPHLLAVWDVRARAPRTVNLRTLRRLAVDGRVHRFAA